MRFFKKDEFRLLWPFYFNALIVSMFLLFGAFYIVYFKHIGLSLTQIGLLISSSGLATMLFEIPTGAIADIFGRKTSTILGIFLTGLIFLFVPLSQSFYFLLFVFFILGVFGSLASGADEAWVIDLLKSKKRAKLIHEFYTKRFSFVNFAMLMSGVIGAFLVKKFGLGVIWPVTGGALISSSIVLLFGQEFFTRKKHPLKEHTKKLISHTKKSLNYSIKDRTLSILLTISIITIFINMFTGPIVWYPLLLNLGFQEHWFGYLFSATFALGVFIPHFTKPLIKKLGGYKNYLIVVLLAMFLFLFLVGFINILLYLTILFILYTSMYDFYGPVRSIYFQKFVPSKMRATISSFRSMLGSFTVIIAAPLSGFVADKIGPQYTILFGSFILIPAIILYSKINDNLPPKRIKRLPSNLK